MRELVELNVGDGVSSLEGLEYAKNLQTLIGGMGSIKDLRPLANLEKLANINLGDQYVTVGQIDTVEGKLKVNTEAYDKTGKNIVKKVSIVKSDGTVVKEQVLDGTDKEVTLDVKGIKSGFYGVHVAFGDHELSGTLLYMTRI